MFSLQISPEAQPTRKVKYLSGYVHVQGYVCSLTQSSRFKHIIEVTTSCITAELATVLGH